MITIGKIARNKYLESYKRKDQKVCLYESYSSSNKRKLVREFETFQELIDYVTISYPNIKWDGDYAIGYNLYGK